MSKILISYRREDSAHVTGRIYDRLTQQFGRTAVFKDVDSIPLGIDFRSYLDQQVVKCDVFLAIIGRHWMKPQGQKGRSRLADPADFVRLEIEAALKRQILVIPVLVEGASIPPVDRLPTSLQGLSYRNGIAVRPDPDFHRDMDRLIEHLRVQIKREQEGLPPLEALHSASDVSLITKMTSSEVEPRAVENVEAALQPSVLESQPEMTPPQEEASAAFSDAHSTIRDESATREEIPSEFERIELESVDTAVPPSELDSLQQQVEQGEEEPAVEEEASRTTTQGFPFYVLVGIGLILLSGATSWFLIFQPKQASYAEDRRYWEHHYELMKREERSVQVTPPPSPLNPSRATTVLKTQENPDTVKQPVRSPKMIRISPDLFMMGTSKENEAPIHEVKFTKAFAIAQYETTFDEYDRFAQATGRPLPKDAGWGRGQRPVIWVAWGDAKAYAEWLSQQTGKRFRLPTEAEWEYAAQGGVTNATWAGTSEEDQLYRYAVFQEAGTSPVGSKEPNELGLYDMSGNVAEWVEDCWHGSYDRAPVNGMAWLEKGGGNCKKRVVRGGSWSISGGGLEVTNREGLDTGYIYNYVGFRLVQDLP